LARYRLIILIAFFLMLYPQGAHAGGSRPERLVRPQDTMLRDRLAIAHLVRGEPMDVIAITPANDDAPAADHYNIGIAMSLTGRYIRALQAFHKAISRSEPGSETRLRSILQFIKLSGYYPGLELPPLSKEELAAPGPELSLALSGYLADRGDRNGALAILERATFQEPEGKIISGILSASHLAAKGDWDASARLIGRVKGDQTSALVDLLYLTRGYHYLQTGDPERARNSFLAIALSSPYSSDALLGKAWSLIKGDDLPGAVIVLEELQDRYRYSQAADDGVLDLALAYRELGLYDRAGTVLDLHLKRLREVRNWLLGLRDTDLRTGHDIMVLLEHTIDGNAPDRGLVDQTPLFVRQWLADISVDPYVRQTSSLLKGIRIAGEKAVKLSERLDHDRDLVRRAIARGREDISRTRLVKTRLEELRNRLGSIRDEMNTTLQNISLDRFASDNERRLISRTVELRERLSLMENSVSKAEGFQSLVGKLSESVTTSNRENQLNRIRKQAYDEIISSRSTLRGLRNTLTSLEGQLWLAVKSGALQIEKKTSLRVTSGKMRAGQVIADTSRSLKILTNQQQSLEELAGLLVQRRNDLDKTILGRLKALGEKIDETRAARLLALAARTAQNIKEAEARTLYTSADIEISRMESTVRSLQEAVQ